MTHITSHDNRSMKPFLTIWIAQAVSLLGSHLVQFAVVWWLARNTGSATLLALATLAALLPQILIAPFAGALADRWSRRAILIIADSMVALATLALAVLFWLDLASLGAIYALLVIRAAGAAFHWPTMQASTTLMVPEVHLARIGGLNQALGGLAGIFIPPLGALAVEVLPMQGVLAIDVATALPAILALCFIPIPQPPSPPASPAGARKPSVLGDMREALAFIWGWKAVLMFAGIGVMVNMLGQAAGSLSPLIVLKHFGGGALELGWFQAAGGIGMLVGGLLLGVWGGFRRRIVPSMLALALDGIAILLVGMSPKGAFLFALGMIFASGFLETIVLGLNGAIGQSIIPPEMQGRVFSLIFSVSQALAPLGLLVAGPTADALGVGFWWILTGIMIAAMGAGGLLIPGIVHIEDPRANTIKNAHYHAV